MVAESFLSSGTDDTQQYFGPPPEEWAPAAPDPWADQSLGVVQYSEPAGPAPYQPAYTEPDFSQGVVQYTEPAAPAYEPGYFPDTGAYGVQQYDWAAPPAGGPYESDVAMTQANIQAQLDAGAIDQQQAAYAWEQAWNTMTGAQDAAQYDLNQQAFADYYGEGPQYDNLRQQGVETGAIRGDIFNTQGAQALGDIGQGALNFAGDAYNFLQDIPLGIPQPGFSVPVGAGYTTPGGGTYDTTVGEASAIPTPYRDEISNVLGDVGGVIGQGLEYNPFTAVGARAFGALTGVSTEDIGRFIGENAYPQNVVQAAAMFVPGIGEAPGLLSFIDDVARFGADAAIARALGGVARSDALDDAIAVVSRLAREETGSINADDIARAMAGARAGPADEGLLAGEAYKPPISYNVEAEGLIPRGAPGPERNVADVFGTEAVPPQATSRPLEGDVLTPREAEFLGYGARGGSQLPGSTDPFTPPGNVFRNEQEVAAAELRDLRQGATFTYKGSTVERLSEVEEPQAWKIQEPNAAVFRYVDSPEQAISYIERRREDIPSLRDQGMFGGKTEGENWDRLADGQATPPDPFTPAARVTRQSPMPETDELLGQPFRGGPRPFSETLARWAENGDPAVARALESEYGIKLTPEEAQAAPEIARRIEDVSARLDAETRGPGAQSRASGIYETGRYGPDTARYNPETGRWEPPQIPEVEASVYNPATGRWENPPAIRGPGAGLAPGQPSALRGWEGNPPAGGIPPGGQGPLPPPPGSRSPGDFNPYGENYGPQLPTKADLRPTDINIFDLLQLPRGLLAGGELSGAVTHLGMQAATHPLEWQNAVTTGVRALADPDVARQADHTFKNTSLHGRLDQKYNAGPNKQFTPSARANIDFSPVYMNYIGGSMNTRQEEFASRLINSIGAFGVYPYEMAARGSATMFNTFRSARQDDFIARLIDLKGGAPGNIDILGPDDLKAIKTHASWIDASTGWGHMGKLEDVSTHLGQILFSPRYLWSQAERASYMLPVRGGFDETWREAVKTHVGFLAAGSAALATAAALGIGEVQTNPNHTDFGKITIDVPGTDAKQTFNIWGPYQPLARMLGQIATGEYSYSGQQKDYFTGETKDYSGSNDTSPFRAFAGWFLNKASPQANILLDILGTKDLGVANKLPEEWQKTLWPEYKDLGLNLNSLLKIATPILVQDIYKAAEKEGLSSALRAGAAGFFGVATNTKTPGDPFLFPEQRAQQDVLENRELITSLLTAAGAPPEVVGMVEGRAYSDLSGRAKEVVREELSRTGKLEQFIEEARGKKSEFQFAMDTQTAIREMYRPAFEALEKHLDSGAPRYEVRNAITAVEKEMKAALYAVPFPEAKTPSVPSTIEAAEAAYRGLYDKAKGPDGKVDYDLLEESQRQFITGYKSMDPQLGRYLEWSVEQRANPKDPDILQKLDTVRPVVNAYYDIPEGVARLQYREQNPNSEALLYQYGYVSNVRSAEAARIVEKLIDDEPRVNIELGWGTRTNPVLSYGQVFPYTREYYAIPDTNDRDESNAKALYRENHPDVDAMLFLAGYVPNVRSLDALEIVQQRLGK